MSDKEKPSILRRAGTFGLNKVRPESVRDASRQSLSSGRAAALKALKPQKIDIEDAKGAIHGRYEDGGVQRFSEMVVEMGLKPEDLEALKAMHKRQFLIYGCLAVAFFIMSLVTIFTTSGQFSALGGVILCIFAVGSIVNAVRSDYAAYQIDQRAFCGLRAYLSGTRIKREKTREIIKR